MNIFSDTAVWQLVVQSDWVSQSILLALFFLSVICGGVIIYNFFYLRRQNRQLAILVKRLRKVKSFNQLLALSKEFQDSVGGRFILRNLVDLKEVTELGAQQEQAPGQAKVRLGLHDLEYLEHILMQSLEQTLIDEERHLPILATSAAVSPLVGLFGTVWGLIHAFVSISQHKTADIAVVSPGIAEALLTTLAGLIVAIPAVVFFIYFSNRIRNIEQRLITVSDTFFALAKRTLQ